MIERTPMCMAVKTLWRARDLDSTHPCRTWRRHRLVLFSPSKGAPPAVSRGKERAGGAEAERGGEGCSVQGGDGDVDASAGVQKSGWLVVSRIIAETKVGLSQVPTTIFPTELARTAGWNFSILGGKLFTFQPSYTLHHGQLGAQE